MAEGGNSQATIFWIFESGDLVAIVIAILGAAYTFASQFKSGFQISYTADVKPFSAEAHTAADRILKGITALCAQQHASVKANIGDWLQKVLEDSFPQFDSSLADLETAFVRWKTAHEPNIDFAGDPIRESMEIAVTTVQSLHSDLQQRPQVIFQAHIDQELRKAKLNAQNAADAIVKLDAEVQKKYGRALGYRLVRVLSAHSRKSWLLLAILICWAVYSCGNTA